MSGKGSAIVIGIAVFMALSVLVAFFTNHDRDKRFGKYIAEHHCSRIGPSGMDTIYVCGDVTLSDSDILKITSNQ